MQTIYVDYGDFRITAVLWDGRGCQASFVSNTYGVETPADNVVLAPTVDEAVAAAKARIDAL